MTSSAKVCRVDPGSLEGSDVFSEGFEFPERFEIVDQDEVDSGEVLSVVLIEGEFWRSFRRVSVPFSKVFKEVRNDDLLTTQIPDQLRGSIDSDLARARSFFAEEIPRDIEGRRKLLIIIYLRSSRDFSSKRSAKEWLILRNSCNWKERITVSRIIKFKVDNEKATLAIIVNCQFTTAC